MVSAPLVRSTVTLSAKSVTVGQEESEDGPSKGIAMLRSDRKLAHVLDRWREAMRADPEAWGRHGNARY